MFVEKTYNDTLKSEVLQQNGQIFMVPYRSDRVGMYSRVTNSAKVV